MTEIQVTPIDHGAINDPLGESSLKEGPQTNLKNNGVNEKEGGRGDAATLTLSHLLGINDEFIGCIYNMPPRHQRRRGLLELGESSMKPRWNENSGVGSPKLGNNFVSRVGTNSITIPYGDIINCNSRFRNVDNRVEPIHLWELGK